MNPPTVTSEPPVQPPEGPDDHFTPAVDSLIELRIPNTGTNTFRVTEQLPDGLRVTIAERPDAGRKWNLRGIPNRQYAVWGERAVFQIVGRTSRNLKLRFLGYLDANLDQEKPQD